MAQLAFTVPEFIEHNSAAEIHERMMSNLPGDIDDMPGGFPYDFTMPAALELDEFINYHLVRSIMIAFPQYAWDDWLDLHGQQVHLTRHQAGYATGDVHVTGQAGTYIEDGTVFCTAATDSSPSIEFATTESATIGEDGNVTIRVRALEAGTRSNVAENTIVVMARPRRDITAVTNDRMSGGSERENDDEFFDRIAAEYGSSMTYLGNDTDYVRWAKEAGAGDCIVVPTANGPGTVKLILVDTEGKPAAQELIQAVYDHIVSESDRTKRLLPTACAELSCVAATTLSIDYVITGLLHDSTTTIEQIKRDFKDAVKDVYSTAKNEGILRYNDVRPVISSISGVQDFETFLVNGGTENIVLQREEYPETGILDFS